MRRKRVLPKKTGKPSGYRTLNYPKKHLRNPEIASTGNLKVRSKLEGYCVDFFQARNIAFLYEPLLLLAGRQYRPDFYLPEFDLFIEICGYSHMPYYVARIEEKRKQYVKHGLKAAFVIARREPELLSKLDELFGELASRRGK